MRTFIIAEAGVNHNGDLSIAKQLVDVAADARADAVKFQAFKAEKLVSNSAAKAKYQTKTSDPGGSLVEMFKKLELSDAYHSELSSYCKKKKIKFMSTPFDEESVDFLENLGMKYFKIASGDITDKALIQHIALKRKPVILSTGMSCQADVEKAIG